MDGRIKTTVQDIECTHCAHRRRSAYGANGISPSLAAAHPVTGAIASAIGKWIGPPAALDKTIVALGKA